MAARIRRWLVLNFWLMGLLVAIGCQSPHWPLDFLLADRQPPEIEAEIVEEPPAESSTAIATDAAKPESAPRTQADAAKLLPLADDRWVMTPRPILPAEAEPATRWRHAGIDTLLSVPAADRPDLQSSLLNANPVVAANTAMILAREQTAEPINELEAAARNVTFKLPLRLAAAETLGMLQSSKAKAAVDRLLDQFCKPPTSDSKQVYLPELHAELVHARAKHVGVADDARLVTALKSPAAEVRLEAAAAWARNHEPAGANTPRELVALASDPDTRVRATALKAIAVNRCPQAFQQLERASHDFDLTVRLTAIAALGELGGEEARGLLEKLRKDPSEISRAAIVGSLAALGASDSVLTAASDRSWRVRQVVAESLKAAKHEVHGLKQDSVALAQQLVCDTSAEVQRRAVESVWDWPLAQSGPVLLAAMADGTYLARKMSAEQLAQQWPAANSFTPDAPATERAKQMTVLKKQWTDEFGTLDRAVVQAVATEAVRTLTLDADEAALLHRCITQLNDPELPRNMRHKIVDSIKAIGPAVVGTLETWSREELDRLPTELFTDVLVDINPTFASLERLASAEAQVRRTAAIELAEQFRGERLSNLAIARLEQVLRLQSDPAVWQTALALVQSDPRAAAVRLAYIAIANNSEDVRRRACEYLGQHASREHFDVLAPLLKDPNSKVAIAAIRAIGATGELEDSAPLEELLVTTDKELRLEAAVALARSKVDAGVAAIERLSREADIEIRRLAAVSMGELQNPVFIPALMARIEDRRDVQIAAMASLSKIAGRDVARDSGESISPHEQVECWKRWYRERETSQ